MELISLQGKTNFFEKRVDEYPETFLTLSVTETENGVACIDGMYVAHVILAYICVISGAFALIARVIPPLKKYHKYGGRIFMITMYFVEGSAILIFNTGLPRAIILFLSIMLFSMVIGYCTIRFRQERIEKQIKLEADKLQSVNSSMTVSQLLDSAKYNVINKPKTWYNRLLSLKAIHGYFMTLAWYQMAGRAGVTNPFDSWDHCYVYPVYKQLGSNGELVLLPGITDDDKTQQLVFFAYVTIPAVLLFAIIGILYSVISSFYLNYKQKRQSITIYSKSEIDIDA